MSSDENTEVLLSVLKKMDKVQYEMSQKLDEVQAMAVEFKKISVSLCDVGVSSDRGSIKYLISYISEFNHVRDIKGFKYDIQTGRHDVGEAIVALKGLV